MSKNSSITIEWMGEDGWFAAQRLLRFGFYIARTAYSPNSVAEEAFQILTQRLGLVPFDEWNRAMSAVEKAMRTDFKKGITHLDIDTLELAPYDDAARQLMVGAPN